MKSKINLKLLEKTVVFLKTKEERETLLKVCAAAGKKLEIDGIQIKISDLLGYYNCLKIDDKLIFGSKEYFHANGFKIISCNNFLKIQNISLHDLIELTK